MQSIAVAVAQPAIVPRDVGANAQEHARAVRLARARVVVFPEFSLTGYELGAPPVALDDPVLTPIVVACAEAGAVAFVGAPIREDGSTFIATLQVDGEGARVAYRKSYLGGDEPSHFCSGAGPAVVTVDGWRFGLGICKDTGVRAHAEATAQLGIDAYLAGLVHRPDELDEQDARGQRMAATCNAYVAFAGAAGPAGGSYDATAGASTIWSPQGRELARCGPAPGEVARATFEPGPEGLRGAPRPATP